MGDPKVGNPKGSVGMEWKDQDPGRRVPIMCLLVLGVTLLSGPILLVPNRELWPALMYFPTVTRMKDDLFELAKICPALWGPQCWPAAHM